MVTDIVDVNELESVSKQLDNLSDQLSDTVNSLNFILIQAWDYDGINISAAARTLRNNLRTISSDMKKASRNISGYTGGIKILDFDDFSIDLDLFSLKDVFTGGVDFVNSVVDTVTKPFENVASNIENITGEVFESLTAPIVLSKMNNGIDEKN